jgi:hypothetical protein
VLSSDLSGVNPETLNGMILYYRLMTKWSGLGGSTELSLMGLSQWFCLGCVEPLPLPKGSEICLLQVILLFAFPLAIDRLLEFLLVVSFLFFFSLGLTAKGGGLTALVTGAEKLRSEGHASGSQGLRRG